MKKVGTNALIVKCNQKRIFFIFCLTLDDDDDDIDDDDIYITKLTSND